jgi:hypothetical protein
VSVLRQSTSADKKTNWLIDWFHKIRAITDEDIKVAGGADAAHYVMFNRQAAIFFALMSAFNCLTLIPMYASGNPANASLLEDPGTNQGITLLFITVINATNNLPKIIGCFSLIIAFYSSGMLVMMYFYWKRSLAWRFKNIS